jgi:hypothetical protein
MVARSLGPVMAWERESASACAALSKVSANPWAADSLAARLSADAACSVDATELLESYMKTNPLQR